MKWDEDYLKKNLHLFNYLTFDLEYDKVNNSLSTITLFRKHFGELKMVCEDVDIDSCIDIDSCMSLLSILQTNS